MKKFLPLFTIVLFLASTTVSNAQSVGINATGTTPDGSAMLDVSSTTKGFLPPRMTFIQRNAVANPVQGLMIYCTNCGPKGEPEYYDGTTWVNPIGVVAPLYPIGAAFEGGILAYILLPEDPGYVVGETHGLIAANVDQGTFIHWYNGSFGTTGAIGTALGTGLANTNLIIASGGATATSYAAGLARAFTGGGYNDWYLPSKDELNKLYSIKTLIIGLSPSNSIYWSSSEFDHSNAWLQDLDGGIQDYFDKSYSGFNVRAIRSF